jgi:hypothetical protein
MMGEAKRKLQHWGQDMVSLIGTKSCRSCAHRVKIPQAPGVLFCGRFPPQTYVIMMEHQGQAGARATPISSYPQVNPDLPCGEYDRSELNASEELSAEKAKAGVIQ